MKSKVKQKSNCQNRSAFNIRCHVSFSVEDLAMNDGSAEKPYYMSDSLKHILHLQNREQPDGTEAGGEK